MRKLMITAVALSLVALLGGAAEAAKPKTLWDDPAGDILFPDPNVPMGQLGLDLRAGSILKKGANLEFTILHEAMPPIGSLPEAARFLWAFSVDGESYRLTIKSVDIGKPDVGQNQTTERVGRADVTGHFRLEGNCSQTPAPAVLTFVNCAPLEYLSGTWDPASKSVTMVVPLKSVKAKPGSVIQIGSGESLGICGICWVTHIAERSLATTIIDSAVWTSTYKVPKK